MYEGRLGLKKVQIIFTLLEEDLEIDGVSFSSESLTAIFNHNAVLAAGAKELSILSFHLGSTASTTITPPSIFFNIYDLDNTEYMFLQLSNSNTN